MTATEKIQNAINKYPINLDIIALIVEDFGKVAEKLSPFGAVTWFKNIIEKEAGENCCPVYKCSDDYCYRGRSSDG